MIIKRNPELQTVKFDTLPLGTVFELDGSIFMSIYPVDDADGDEHNAVILEHGETTKIAPDANVIEYPSATLTLG